MVRVGPWGRTSQDKLCRVYPFPLAELNKFSVCLADCDVLVRNLKWMSKYHGKIYDTIDKWLQSLVNLKLTVSLAKSHLTTALLPSPNVF